MPYTEIDPSNIAVRGEVPVYEEMVVFDYDGISYVYYTSIMDTYYGMVEEHDITLNPYLRDEGEMHKTGIIGKWDSEKNTAVFKDKWLNQDRHQVCKETPFYLAPGPHLPAGHPYWTTDWDSLYWPRPVEEEAWALGKGQHRGKKENAAKEPEATTEN